MKGLNSDLPLHITLIFLCCLYFGACKPNPDDAPVAYWTFDEGSGQDLTDISGNGLHGRITNGTWTTGKQGTALEFNGDSFVELPDEPALRLPGDLTIMAWVRKTEPSRTGKSMGIVSRSSEGQWDYDLFMSTSRLEHPAFYSDAFQTEGSDIEVISSQPVILKRWHHIAVIRQGSTGRIYIDGRVTGTANIPESFPKRENKLRIGHDHDGGFVGVIDEVRIYERALSASEIRDIFTASRQDDIPFTHTTVDTSFGGIRAVGDIDGDELPDFVHSTLR